MTVAHAKIETAVAAACAIEPRFVPVMIGNPLASCAGAAWSAGAMATSWFAVPPISSVSSSASST